MDFSLIQERIIRYYNKHNTQIEVIVCNLESLDIRTQ